MGALVALVAGLAGPAQAAPVSLTQVGTLFNNMVGIDYHEPSNKLVVTVNYPAGHPHNFELVAQDGTRTTYGTISGLTDEVKVATVRSGSCQGGFAVGDTFSGTGVPGEIARISPDGSFVQAPWVHLPGETGLMRGSLFHDRYCAAGGDLIAVSTAGGVWRVSSSGVGTLIANVGMHLEGVSTFPDDPVRYGPWAGMIVAGAEHVGRFVVVDPATGASTMHNVDGIPVEDIDIIPANENFFGVDYGSGRLMGAAAPQWSSMVGDILVAQEHPGHLWRLRWNGTMFETELLATVFQWEHVTFAPSGVAEIPPVDGPPTADAGADQILEQTGPSGATASLDGSGSTDPDGDALTYTWSGSFGTASGATPSVALSPGTHPITLTVEDGNGGVDSDSLIVTVADTTDPTIVGSRFPAANANGWNNGPVQVTFTCGDGGSGIASCTGDEVLSTEGAGQSVTGVATDVAGHTATDTVSGINIDLTDPEISFAGNAGSYGVDDPIAITCSATDAPSGIDVATCPGATYGPGELDPGTYTLSASATDLAGNIGSGSTTFTVRATVESLCELVEAYVDHEGVARSLCAKLNSAAAADARGNEAASQGALAAFRSEVSSQTGRHGLTEEEAATLIEHSLAL